MCWLPRSGVEPIAMRVLAESGTPEQFDELDDMLARDIPAGWEHGRLAEATGEFHRRMVEMSGNATLTIIAGMLHEITVRHTAFAIKENRQMTKADYGQADAFLPPPDDHSCARPMVQAQKRIWRKHLDTARDLLLTGFADVKVRDVMQ